MCSDVISGEVEGTQWLASMEAASFIKRESYSSYGSPSNSALALTITAYKSLTCSGCLTAVLAMNELKHITHSSIVLICFVGASSSPMQDI